MIKNIVLMLMILIFVGCDIKTVNLDDNIINHQNKIYTNDYCTNFSYISKENSKEYGNLFIEYIDLDLSCNWNGFQRGYFDYLFETTLKLKSLKAVERLDYGNFEFSTYLINDNSYMNLIYKFGANEDMFIIDYDGKLSDKLIKEFNQDYINKYINKTRFISNYSNSLVKMNIINSYFSREREPFELK